MTSKLEFFNTNTGSWENVNFDSWRFTREMGSLDSLIWVGAKDQLGKYSPETEFRATYNNSLVFGGYSKNEGRLNQAGEFEMEVIGYGKKTMNDNINISGVSTNVDVATQLANATNYTDNNGSQKSFTLNTPGSPTPVDIPNYTNEHRRAGRVKREMEEWFEWVLWFEPDGNAYYVPWGHNSSGKTIDIPGGDNAVIPDYNQGVTDEIISKVRVIGTDGSGKIITKTKTAKSPDATRYVVRRAGYNITEAEAQRIADNMVRGKKTTEAKVMARGYEDTFNQKIDLIDSDRTGGNSKTFTVQRIELEHSGRNTLLLETSKRPKYTDNEARKRKNLKQEESSQISKNQKDVGKQGLNNAGTNRTTDTAVSTTDNPDEKDVLKTGNVDEVVTNQGYFLGVYKDDASGDLDGNWHPVATGVNLGSKNYLFHASWVNLYIKNSSSFIQSRTYDVYLRLENTTQSTFFPDSNGVRIVSSDIGSTSDEDQVWAPGSYLHAPFNWKNDDYNLEYKFENTFPARTVDINYSYHGSDGHVHNDSIQVEDSAGNVSPNMVKNQNTSGNVNTQPTFGVTGQTDSKNVDLGQEAKDDR